MAGSLDVNDLHYTQSGGDKYSAWGAYGRSKLANVLFSKGLAQRLPENGKVACVSVHPGVIRTPLWRSTPASGGLGGWLLGTFMADKDVPQGAATTLWGCLSDEVRRPTLAGAYLSDCARGSVSALGSDEVLAEKLWRETEAQLDAALAKRGLKPDGSVLA
jgi:NAD(P)-dependent dehydrogenase (short-subunit alcohol dehydrogenase family)